MSVNHFKVELNPNIKEGMSVCQYISYEDLYDTAVNVDRAMMEKKEYCNEQHVNKIKGDQ